MNMDKKIIKTYMVLWSNINGLKFGYSEKDTKIWPIFHFLFTIIDVKLQLEDGPNFGGLLRISRLYTTRLIILLFSANFFFSYIFGKFISLLYFCLLLIIKLWKRKITATIAAEKKLKICTHTQFSSVPMSLVF